MDVVASRYMFGISGAFKHVGNDTQLLAVGLSKTMTALPVGIAASDETLNGELLCDQHTLNVLRVLP